MKQLIIILSVLILSITLLHRCASVSPPTGGEKDELAPKVISTIPAQKSTNYNGKIVEMLFDEAITLENIKQELLITPRIEGNYEFEVKKNRVSLKFDKSFSPNTTYTLNFRKAIKDITEKNIAENEKIVFSTGNTIDSLYINGSVKDLLTNKPVENALVMLYQYNDTSVITKHPPYYFTKTDKQGKYLVENLKGGIYNIYALVDYNNNLKYEGAKEKIAFLPDSLALTTNIDSLEFNVTIIDNEKPKILRGSADTDIYTIELNEGLINANVEKENQEIYFQIEKNKFIQVYNTFQTTDSIAVQITAQDSAQNILQTETKIKFNAAGKTKPRVRPFKVDTDPKGGDKITGNLSYEIAFTKPVRTYDLGKIQVLADTITPVPLDETKDFAWNESRTQLKIEKQIPTSKLTRVEIPEETFFSVENDTNKHIVTDHELKDIEEYGTISGMINTREKNFIIQLLNANYDVVEEQRNISTYSFNYLQAGTYFLRVIIDSNGNGRWDQGNFTEKILPERILYNKNEIPLKQNWEQTGQDFSF
ncbi:Ig-like domain-containing protein [Rhodocytophaga aerolata]|uniref:Ig-like domain-containing protein n=1 Tax=Rhodocytophaga aerolata TaxID=455078 RepID=A0ABT8R3K1_9BACT|nr:Ig-like domain-containing protein [Rhodocytophaga aerolata]MDO1446246.1 Ig-like domain-containing protein [Rhodocytophaga aerolata]